MILGQLKGFLPVDTDAVQNVTEALLACRLAAPGVYVAMHNRLLRFPGVLKDRATLNFVKTPSGDQQEVTRAGIASER